MARRRARGEQDMEGAALLKLQKKENGPMTRFRGDEDKT